MNFVLKKLFFIVSKIFAWIIAMGAVVYAVIQLRSSIMIATAPLIMRNFEGKYLHSFIDKMLVIFLGIGLLSMAIVTESLLAKAKDYPAILRLLLYVVGGSGVAYLISLLLLLIV